MTRRQWLLIVVIAAGLVGMHHLLVVCTAPTMPIGPGSSPVMVAPMSTTLQRADPAPAGTNAVGASSVMTSQGDCCDPMDMVGHFCLAVLTAITTLHISERAICAESRGGAEARLHLQPGHFPDSSPGRLKR